MAAVLKLLVRGYFKLFHEMSDPRADDYLFMDSVFYPIVIMAGYLYVVLNLGPRMMEKRQPFKIDGFIKVFNLLQVLINGYICYYATNEVFVLDWSCSPVDYSRSPHNMFVFKLVYIYFITKLLDLLDTLFFVLRKKNTHVSFLHVYHHFGMVAIIWIGTKFLGGGHSIFLGWANSLVHTIMYSYYLLTIWKPEYKQSIWWKRYITQMQLLQFGFFLVIFGQLLFRPTCLYPKIVSYFIVPQSIFMTFLFGDFYIRTYIKKKNTKQPAPVVKDS